MKRYLFVLALIISELSTYAQCNTVVTGPALVCTGTLSRYYASSIPQGNFSWTVNGGHIITGTPSTPQIQWTNPGTWQISVTNTLCPGSPVTIYDVTVVNTSTINAPTAISGTDSNCAGTTSVYSVPSIAGLVPVWYIVPQNPYSSPSIPTLTPSGNQVSITWPTGSSSNYALYASYSNGTCTGQQTYKNLTTVAGTVMPSISGSTSLCQGQSILYSATSEVQDTYTWSVTGGNTITSNGNQATVQWINQGTFTLTVMATNPCSATPKITTKTIQVGAQLSTPGTISKQNSMTCLNQTERYSVSPVAGATSYIWTGTLSSGNWEVTTSTPYYERAFSSLTSGTISVRVSNGICESQFSPDFIVNVGPPQLGLTIPLSTCVGTPVTATVTSSSIDLTGLPVTWNVGIGQILSYPTSNSAVIKWNSPDAGTNVSAIVITPCGSFAAPGPLISPPRIEIHDASMTTYPITGTTQACLGTYTYSMANSPGMNVAWDILYQGGGSTGFGFSNVTNGIQIGWSTPGNYTIKATTTNACGSSQVQTLNVTVTSSPKPIAGYINGSLSEYLCLDFPNTRNYSVTPTGGITYTWGVQGLPGDVINASGNSANITWTGEAYSQVYVTPSTATCTGEKTFFYSTHYANSAIGTLSSTGPSSACTYTPVPITLSVTSATGYVRYQVRKKGDNGPWTAWTEFNGPDYTIDYSLPGQPVYSAYYYEFQAIARNSTCAPAYSNVVSFTGYVTPYFSNPSSYFDPKSICSGTAVSVTPTSTTPGTSVAWTSSVTGPVTGASISGAGDISNVLTNTGSTIGTVTYSLTPSANGCTSITYTITRYVYPNPVVTPNQTKTICSGSAVDYNIIVIPEVELNWPDPDGSGPATSVSNRNWTPDILDQLTNTGASPLLVTYQVTPFYRINGSLGCSGAAANVVITVNPKPMMTSLTSGVGCNNIPLNHPLASNIPSTYTWYAANNVYTTGESLSAQSSAVINNSISTSTQQTVNYTVTPTSTDGCLGNSQIVSMLINVSPIATITPSSTSICANGSVILNANTGIDLSYQWFEEGVSIPDATSASYTASNAGNYTVQVTNLSTNCSNISPPTVITVSPLPTVAVVPSSAEICTGSSVLLSGNPENGNVYQWYKDGNILPGNTAVSMTATQAGIYSLRKTTISTGCSSLSNSVPVTLKPVPVALTNNTATCSGGPNITLTSNLSETTFLWVVQSKSSIIGGATVGQTGTTSILPTLTNSSSSSSGTVVFRITPTANGCTGNFKDVTVTVNALTTGGTLTANQNICPGGDPAAFTQTTASTGPGTLSYQWQSSIDNIYFPDISGATASTYNVPPGLTQTTYFRRMTTAVQNGVTCSAFSNPLTVTVNSLTGGVIAANQTICSGGNPVAFTQVNSAVGPGTLSYQWQKSTNGTAYSNITGATATTYDAPSGLTQNTYYKRNVLSSLCGLSASSNPVLVSIDSVNVLITPASTEFCTGQSINVTLTATSGTGYTYQWKKSGTNIAGATSSTYQATQTGSYTVTVTSPNGCQKTSSAAVVTQSTGTGNVRQFGDLCADGYVDLLAAWHSSGSNFLWSTNETTETIRVYDAGTYSVTYTSASGCSESANISVELIPNPGPCIYARQASPKTIDNQREDKSSHITLYPNPADETLTIQLPEPVRESLTISLYSQYGQEVKSAVLAKGDYKIEFDTKLLSKGMYVLTLRTNSGNINMNRKVIINH